jgi:hypothetical protein
MIIAITDTISCLLTVLNFGLGTYFVKVVKKKWDSFRNLSVTLRNNVGLEKV